MWVIMLKKIVAILLIVLLAGATTACASDQDDDQNVEQFNWVLAGYKKSPAAVVEEQLDYVEEKKLQKDPQFTIQVQHPDD